MGERKGIPGEKNSTEKGRFRLKLSFCAVLVCRRASDVDGSLESHFHASKLISQIDYALLCSINFSRTHVAAQLITELLENDWSSDYRDRLAFDWLAYRDERRKKDGKNSLFIHPCGFSVSSNVMFE